MLRLIGLVVVIGGGLYAANALGIYTPALPNINASHLPAPAENGTGLLDKALDWVEKASQKGGLGHSISQMAPAGGSRFTDRVVAKHQG